MDLERISPDRVFGGRDQRSFAALSGDRNPIHIDAVAARRLLYGAPVVHGLHTLLWGLDRIAAVDEGFGRLRRIEADFTAPLYLNVAAWVVVRRRPSGEIDLKVATAKGTVLSAVIICASGELRDDRVWKPPPQEEPVVFPESELGSARGVLPLQLDPTGLARLFPNLRRRFSLEQAAVLLATTRLVGMKCPGLHSLFKKVEIEFDPNALIGDEISYEVEKWEARFHRLRLQVAGKGVTGRIESFVRPGPANQRSMVEVAQLVAPNECSGQRALIIGGSRGIGEVTAKLLAAGGADVLITYHRGEAEARRVVDEIILAGGRARFEQLDVLASMPTVSVQPSAPFTHVYYFATPRVQSGAFGIFDPDLYREFCSYYVTGLGRILDWLVETHGERFAFFYPSTVFLDDPASGFLEYCVAKMAGETYCRRLSPHHPNAQIIVRRLPRLSTDQTMTLMPVAAADPAPVMIREIRALIDGAGPAAGRET